jgi:hypothetical protein
MNIYIWYGVANLTTNYHSGGGLVIVAPTLERARELLAAPADCEYPWHDADDDHTSSCRPERASASAMKDDPDVTYALQGDVEEKITVFPDAGCC